MARERIISDKEFSFSEIVAKKAAKKYKTIKVEKDTYYSHPTFLVSSVSEYIGLISIISAAKNELTNGDTVVYRGMANEAYDLCPGLARINSFSGETEQYLINEFLTRRPDAFTNLSFFDTLATMQHYGLPTRLLDFSTNPLVALFFACESLFEKRGRIVCHNTFLENDEFTCVKTICDTVFRKSFDEAYFVDEYLCCGNYDLDYYLREIYLYREAIVVRPKYWNQRIYNQSGVFMFFPNELNDLYWSIVRHTPDLGIDEAIRQYGQGKIDKAAVEKILKMECKGSYIKQEDSFLTRDHCKEIYELYENNKANLSNTISRRFKMSPDLKLINKQDRSKAFCSIIIEGKNKKRMIKELAGLGVGVDYIYPELEYTAKEIKRLVE